MANKHQHKEVRSQSEPKLPKGHFGEDGLSKGKKDGAVRPTADAYNTNSKKEERK